MDVHDSVLKASVLVGGEETALETVLTPVTIEEEVSVVVKDPDVLVNVST